jgi:hypothetical protein
MTGDPMKLACLLAPLLVASTAALTACTGPLPGPAMGTVTLDLVGTAPSGRSYRLRDATITVQGPGSVKVWNTEDAPDQTSLSADVVIGDYTARLADGWRLERIDGSAATPVAAELVSDNPVQFTVFDHERTGVPLRFRVQGDEVDMTQGYDISVEVEEPGPPVVVVSNGGNPDEFPRQPSITVFPASSDGDQPPLRTIAGPHTTLRGALGIAVARDRIIVCDGNAIVMFPLAAAGDVAPIARIAGSMTGLLATQAIAVWNGEIYVVQARSISVFPLTGNGNIPPTRKIDNIDLFNPFHLVIAHGEIFLVDSAPQVEAHVKVFPASATGDTEPLRVMRWVPSRDTLVYGIAIRGGELFVSTESTVDVLPADGNGPVAPLRSLPIPGPFQLMAFRNELYMAAGPTNTVQVFSADATDSGVPTRVIRGPSTQLADPLAVFVE